MHTTNTDTNGFVILDFRSWNLVERRKEI